MRGRLGYSVACGPVSGAVESCAVGATGTQYACCCCCECAVFAVLMGLTHGNA